MTIDRPELFLIPHETVEALSVEEVEASYRDMEELGIAKLPYTLTDIGIDLGDFSNMPDINLSPLKSLAYWSKFSNWEIRACFIDDELFDILLKGEEDIFKSVYASPLSFPGINTEDTRLGFARMAERVRKVLIVLLATKNIIKTRVENKLWKFGIGKKKKQSHRYVTTISIPPTANLSPNQGHTGITMRPHLRRGHIRRQRYGPKRAFIQKVWIEPCFINADPDFISSRTAYNTFVGTS